MGEPTESNVTPIKAGPAMVRIPQTNLQQVWEWLNSDAMTMPQNQVRAMQRLLETAQMEDQEDNSDE